MYKVVVLTDRENADGFRLAGVEVVEADSNEVAAKVIERMLDKKDVGILAVNEGFLEAVSETVKKRIEETYRPVVISIPIAEELGAVGRRSDALSKIIHRAVGFDVTLRKE